MTQHANDSSTGRATLSVILIAMNEEDRIIPCLESLKGWVDEIVVLDSGSSDATVEICQRYTANVQQTDWPGEGIQRQRSLEAATGDWVLWVDSDERVTPELREEIENVLSIPDNPITGYSIPWETDYFGKICIRGGLGDRHIRLFRRDLAQFNTAVKVHPKIELSETRIGKLNGRLTHESFRDFTHLATKNVEYSLRSADEKIAKDKSSSAASATSHALWRFIQLYFIRLGILDGQRGYINAVMASQYVFNKYAAVWASKHQRKS